LTPVRCVQSGYTSRRMTRAFSLLVRLPSRAASGHTTATSTQPNRGVNQRQHHHRRRPRMAASATASSILLGASLLGSACGTNGGGASPAAANTGAADTDGTSDTPSTTSSGSHVASSCPECSPSNGASSTMLSTSSTSAESDTRATNGNATESVATESPSPTTTGNRATVTSEDDDDASTGVSTEVSNASDGETPSASFYPCDTANSADYDVTVSADGAIWTVARGGSQVYAGDNFETALSSAYGALTAGRTTKETILVQGDGEISASSQV